MEGIQFEEDREYSGLKGRAVQGSAEKQSFMMWLLEKAGVEDKTTANFALLGVAVVLFGITLFLYAGIFAEPKKDLSLDAKIRMQVESTQQHY